jgi:hypothetical protein
MFQMKDELTTLMNLLNEEGFFIIDSKDWVLILLTNSITVLTYFK